MTLPEDAEERAYKHWATVVSEEALSVFGNKQVGTTGWDPIGHYHLGNFKEVVTGRAIYRELLEAIEIISNDFF